ncbi:MAG: hypothetical protein IKD80_07545, partial [Selenomonadaceae bacterium]|nr:hypothetical protein [Selenomonadaceae bacterium]
SDPDLKRKGAIADVIDVPGNGRGRRGYSPHLQMVGPPLLSDDTALRLAFTLKKRVTSRNPRPVSGVSFWITFAIDV